VGEEHLQTWHVPNVHKCTLLGKEFRAQKNMSLHCPLNLETFKKL